MPGAHKSMEGNLIFSEAASAGTSCHAASQAEQWCWHGSAQLVLTSRITCHSALTQSTWPAEQQAERGAFFRVWEYDGMQRKAGWTVALRSPESRQGGRYRLPASVARAAARRCVLVHDGSLVYEAGCHILHACMDSASGAT